MFPPGPPAWSRAPAGARFYPFIYGEGIATIVGTIWSGALMLDSLGQGDATYRAAHDAILGAIEQVLEHGPRTPDLGGKASTAELGRAIAAAI